MAEYIIKEALQEKLSRKKAGPANKRYTEGWNDAILMVKSMIHGEKAADVAPVRHGRWEWFEEWSPSTPESPKECTDCGWRCGRCKVKLDDMVGWYWDDPYDEPKLNYCPNCGMKRMN